jgi:hypothetical protein
MRNDTNSSDWLKHLEYSMNAKKFSKQPLKTMAKHLDEIRDAIFDCESTRLAGGKLRQISDRDSMAKICALQTASRFLTHWARMLSDDNGYVE